MSVTLDAKICDEAVQLFVVMETYRIESGRRKKTASTEGSRIEPISCGFFLNVGADNGSFTDSGYRGFSS